MKFSSSKCRKDAATSVLNGIMKNHKKLIEECEMFIIELNKCAMLPHEEWFETIETLLENETKKDMKCDCEFCKNKNNKESGNNSD